MDSLTSWGTHSLIKDGAKMVTTVDDIIEEIKPILQNYVRRFNLTNKPHLFDKAGSREDVCEKRSK